MRNRNNYNNDYGRGADSKRFNDSEIDSKAHLTNSIFISPENRMSQGPYESLKKQIAFDNLFKPTHQDKSGQQSIAQAYNQLSKYIRGKQGKQQLDITKLKNIESIKLHPIVNLNFMSTFNQNQYGPLQNQDKVKIVKQKVFKVQNYYNYLYQLQSRKRFEQAQANLQQLVKRSKLQSKKNARDEQFSPVYRPSANQNRSSIRKDDFRGSLDPVYKSYAQKKEQRYFLKQGQREQVQNRNSVNPNQSHRW